MAGWLVDTSAWSRRHLEPVADELTELAADPGGLWVSPPVLLELLREPQGTAVSEERETVLAILKLAPVDNETFALAATAMEQLALHQPEAHRLPVTDLVTAAIAHQRELGVVHCDDHFELIAEHSGLAVGQHRIEVPPPARAHPAASQRELRRELAQILHTIPHAKAEAFLATTVAAAKKL